MGTVVSHSEAESFLACRKKWYYSFGERLEPKRPPTALSRGTIGHEAMEQFFLELQAGNVYDTAVNIGIRTIRYHVTDDDPDYAVLGKLEILFKDFTANFRQRIESWEIVHVEQEFWLKLGEDESAIDFAFKPDLIVRENGILTLFDYKFSADFYSPDELALYPQLPKYMGALRAVGVDVVKANYIFMRTRDNAKGKLTDIINVPINSDRLRTSWYEQINTSLEIQQYKSLPLAEMERRSSRATNSFCKWCSFRELCTATLQGSTGQILREENYRPNTYGYSNKES